MITSFFSLKNHNTDNKWEESLSSDLRERWLVSFSSQGPSGAFVGLLGCIGSQRVMAEKSFILGKNEEVILNIQNKIHVLYLVNAYKYIKFISEVLVSLTNQ